MRLRLLLLALGTFAVGTDTMVMAGILDGIAGDLGVSVSAAGQLVSVFALSYALLAPVLAALTARWDRRRLLLAAMGVFTLANALSALAPGYGTLLATRVLAAAGAALYSPTAAAVATALAPPERRGRALATVLGGMTVATALGVPLGAYLGSADWRRTMWLIAALGVVAFAGLALLMRGLPAPAGAPGLRERLAPLRNRRVAAGATTTLVFFLAFNSVYIYLATAVRPATGGDQGRLSLILLATGLASIAGSWLGGRLVDRLGVRTVLLAGSVAAGLAFAALPWLSRSLPGALAYAVVSPPGRLGRERRAPPPDGLHRPAERTAADLAQQQRAVPGGGVGRGRGERGDRGARGAVVPAGVGGVGRGRVGGLVRDGAAVDRRWARREYAPDPPPEGAPPFHRFLRGCAPGPQRGFAALVLKRRTGWIGQLTRR
ncbi:MFS transporter [Streptomyces sp. AV19]|uniref:MFS transporter n=1 Tax=Streptomyces sp. AV19 TaxID=2793068 RepID=UPI0024130DD7|nr:MFS transporter [Streptomyces sp. AV19]MDG4534132.1 MFS transporter [Streptomyces sp. AV19]